MPVWFVNNPNGHYIHPGCRVGHGRISQPGRIALALTEAGLNLSTGRVYIISPFRAANSSESQENADLLNRLGQIPEFVYIPEVWSLEEKTQWPSLDANSQWYRIGGRAGWLEDHVPVLPFGVVALTSQTRKKPTPAYVAITVVLGKEHELRVENNTQNLNSVLEVMEKLEQQYWNGTHTVFLGSLLDSMVACD